MRICRRRRARSNDAQASNFQWHVSVAGLVQLLKVAENLRFHPALDPAGLDFDVEQERRGALRVHPKLIAKRQRLPKNSGSAFSFDILEFP